MKLTVQPPPAQQHAHDSMTQQDDINQAIMDAQTAALEAVYGARSAVDKPSINALNRLRAIARELDKKILALGNLRGTNNRTLDQRIRNAHDTLLSALVATQTAESAIARIIDNQSIASQRASATFSQSHFNWEDKEEKQFPEVDRDTTRVNIDEEIFWQRRLFLSVSIGNAAALFAVGALIDWSEPTSIFFAKNVGIYFAIGLMFSSLIPPIIYFNNRFLSILYFNDKLSTYDYKIGFISFPIEIGPIFFAFISSVCFLSGLLSIWSQLEPRPEISSVSVAVPSSARLAGTPSPTPTVAASVPSASYQPVSGIGAQQMPSPNSNESLDQLMNLPPKYRGSPFEPYIPESVAG